MFKHGLKGVRKTGKVMKLSGYLLIFIGLLVAFVGFSMWRSPKLDWEHFMGTISSFPGIFIEGISRLIEDPFAIVGLLVMIGGLVLFYEGYKKVKKKI